MPSTAVWKARQAVFGRYAVQRAYRLFGDLLTNPLEGQLKKCSRCGSYFAGPSNKRFCDKSCKNMVGRARKHEQLMAAVSRTLERYSSMKRPPADWKTWAAKQHRRDGITKKFITRNKLQPSATHVRGAFESR